MINNTFTHQAYAYVRAHVSSIIQNNGDNDADDGVLPYQTKRNAEIRIGLMRNSIGAVGVLHE